MATTAGRLHFCHVGASGMSGELGPTGAIGATGAWLKQNSLLSMRSARASIKLDCIGPPG